MNLLKPFVLALVLADGTLTQADRQHAAWDYSGVLASAAVGTAGARLTVADAPVTRLAVAEVPFSVLTVAATTVTVLTIADTLLVTS